MSTNRMVAMCDIVGFKDYIEKHGTDKTFNDFKILIEDTIAKALRALDPISMSYESLEDIFSKNRYVGVTWFADTVLFYSKDDSEESLLFVITVANFFLNLNQYYTDFKFRCGIDFGEFAVDSKSNIFIGDALIGAHHLEENQEWFGGSLTLRAKDRVNIMSNPGRHNYLVPYNVPLKNGEPLSTCALWVGAFRHVDDLAQFIPEGISEDVKIKYLNSIKFQEDVFPAKPFFTEC